MQQLCFDNFSLLVKVASILTRNSDDNQALVPGPVATLLC